MIKSPFKAIVICVLPDEKISKNPAFPADMITQGGYGTIAMISGYFAKRLIQLPVAYKSVNFYSGSEMNLGMSNKHLSKDAENLSATSFELIVSSGITYDYNLIFRWISIGI